MRIADFRQRVAQQETSQKAGDFVRNAFDVDRKNTRYVSLADVRETPRGWRSTTITKVPGERARRHVQLVHPPTGYSGSFRACSGLRLDCDCSRFLFVWNHALNEADLAVRDRTNGEAPVVTNPTGSLGVCKHGVLVLRYLQRENPTFNGTRSEPRSGGPGDNRPITLTTVRSAMRK